VRNFGGRVLALSPNLPEFAARIREELELPFIVASDPGNRIADKYGLKLTLFDEERKSLIENKNVNLHTYNGNNDWTLPVTARYVIRPDGYVQYVYANLDHTIAPDYSKLLAMVKKAAEA
jgi:peroxiredoxin